MVVSTSTRTEVLRAAKTALIESGYSKLSTRRIAELAGVPLSQIHYHFGSKKNLVLEVLAEEDRQLLERQSRMYASTEPLWQQWEQACSFLDEDLDSGYVRVLQEMMAAGWSDAELADQVRSYLKDWFELLRGVAREATTRLGIEIMAPDHISTLVGAAFLGAEAMILLGLEDREIREALRAFGDVIRQVEEASTN